MAGIDYTIPGQFKGVQIEPPENAMMRAMQLRGMQEASQLNALKMQEYQQDVMEKNELAKIYANPDLKYGSPEFFSEVSRRAPRYFEKIATGEQQRQLAISTQATREQQRREAEQKLKKDEEDYRSGVRNNRLIQIANAETPEEAYEMLQHYYGQGDLGYTDYRSLAPQLIENPNWEKTRTSLLARTLPAEKQLTVPFDIRKAQAGATEEEQKLAAAELDFETKQLDARRKQFDSVYPPNLIRSKEDVRNRILLQAQDPALKQLLTRFGTLEEIIARDVDEFGRDPLGYKQRLSGVPTAEILKAAKEKDKEAYFAHVRQAIANKTKPLSEEAFMASRRQISSAAEAPVSDGAASGVQEVQAFNRNVPRPVIDASAAVAPDAAISAEAARALAPAVAKEQAEYTIHPDAQAYYDLFALTKNQADKAAGDAIQRAYIKQIELQNKPDQLMSVSPGGVVIDKATGAVKFTAPPAEKPEPKTEAQRNYDAAIADGSFIGTFAQYLDQQRETEAEREYRKAKLPVSQGGSGFTGTFLDFKKLIAKANKIVVQQAPNAKPTDTSLDFLANQYILDNKTISAVPKQLRMAVINRATEILSGQGVSGRDMASQVVMTGQDTAAQKAVVKDFTSGKAAVATRSFNTAIDHLETMGKLATALQNGDMRAFNSIGNSFAKQSGVAAPANFEAAKSIVGGEIAKALTGANMALADRLEIRDSIIATSSPAQLHGVLNTYKQLLAGQLNSLNIQYRTGTGRDDFRNKLSPASRRELDALNPQAPRPAGTLDKNNKWLK